MDTIVVEAGGFGPPNQALTRVAITTADRFAAFRVWYAAYAEHGKPYAEADNEVARLSLAYVAT